MAKNKVLICGNFVYPSGNAPGKRVFGIEKVLRDAGYDVSILGISNERNASDVLATKRISGGTTIYDFKAPSMRDRVKVGAYLDEFKAVVGDIGAAEISHIIFYGSPVLALWLKKANSYAKRLGIKTVFDCVDWIEYSGGGNAIVDLVKFIDTNYMKRCVVRKMSGLFAISRFLYDYYERGSVPVFRLPPIGESMIGEPCENTGAIKFVYPCGKVINSTKKADTAQLKDRVDTTAKTMAHLAEMGLDFHLDFFGITVEDYLFNYPDDKPLLEGALKDKVAFRGFVDNDVMISEWQSADFSISMREKTKVTTAAFPFKIAESVCLGTAVITNDTSNITEYIKDGVNGVIVPFDAKSAAEKIYDACMSRAAVNQMKKECQSNNVFDFERFTKPLAQFLQNEVK